MSSLERKLLARDFVVTAELPVIDAGGHAEILRQLEPMRPFVDAFNATDNPSGHAHCSSLSVSIALLQSGAEPVMQLACRDRNRLALEADLIGASMHGITNISCMTGDDVTAGDEPEARRVFDLDGPQLVAMAGALAGGSYLSGRPVVPAPHLFVGAVENPGAPPYEYRVKRAHKKVGAGARFLQLQLCFAPRRLERFMRAAHADGLTERVSIIPSVLIVRSAATLRFVDEWVPGVEVPPETVARVEAAADQQQESFELAYELAAAALALPGVAGLHFISFRRDAGIAKLCTRLGIPPRAEREEHGHRPAVPV